MLEAADNTKVPYTSQKASSVDWSLVQWDLGVLVSLKHGQLCYIIAQ